MSQVNKIENIKIQMLVHAGTSETVRERLKAEGTIVKCSGKFYLGQVLGLKVTVFVLRAGSLVIPMYTFPSYSKQYLCGDDQDFNDAMSLEVENDDELVVIFQNDNGFDCDGSVTVTVDYYGGKQRVVS